MKKLTLTGKDESDLNDSSLSLPPNLLPSSFFVLSTLAYQSFVQGESNK